MFVNVVQNSVLLCKGAVWKQWVWGT